MYGIELTFNFTTFQQCYEIMIRFLIMFFKFFLATTPGFQQTSKFIYWQLDYILSKNFIIIYHFYDIHLKFLIKKIFYVIFDNNSF